MKHKYALAGFALTLITGTAFAQSFEVTKLNDNKTRAIAKKAGNVEAGQTLTFTDSFAENCDASVVKVTDKTVILDVSTCANGKSIKVGDTFTESERPSFAATPAAAPVTPVKRGNGPTIDEDWYTLWGLGFARANYGDGYVETLMDNTDNVPGVDRSTLSYDMFGFYWPMADKKSMQGFVVNVVYDSLDGSGGTFSIDQTRYAYSYHQFFGANIGDGWFWRGDIGLVQYTVSLDTTTIYDDDSSDFGLGVLAGGGYGFSLGSETRLLVGAYLSHNSAESDKINNFALIFGFLF